MKNSRILFAAFALVIVALPLHADTLRVMTYNSLNFRGNQDADRLPYFRRVVGNVHPDVVAMQEIISDESVDQLLSFAFLQNDDDWASAAFDDGPDTDNILFYRTSKVTLMSQRSIPTDLRDFNEYILRPVSPDTSQRLRMYSAHLKAGDTENDMQRRAIECTALRQQLNLVPPGTLFLMVGDFNLYSSSDDSYQILLDGTDPDGQLFDPIDSPGDWSNSATFASIHTQSPRASSFGGGSGGGMDDRFDFILASAGLMDTAGTYILPATYHPVGNDGQHFNQSINDGVNYAVPDSVADALYYASDHLPVAVDILLRASTDAVVERPIPQRFELLTCYPNPFNASLTVHIAELPGPAALTVYDVLGRAVYSRPVSAGSARTIFLDFSSQTTGTYYVRLVTPAATATERVLQIR